MVAHTKVYLGDLQGALDISRAATEAAARVGHHRAEVIAHYAACNVFRTTDEGQRAKEHAERGLALVRRLGAGRFEAVSLNDKAMVLRAEGRGPEALDLVGRALAISRQTGIGFMGPWILGHLARTTDDPAVQRAALVEGEEILRQGAVGHNYLWFHRYAMEACLTVGDWRSVEHHAGALEEYIRPEPLPWADFFIARARGLAAFGAGRRDRALVDELRGVRAKAEALGWQSILPELDAALAAICPDPNA